MRVKLYMAWVALQSLKSLAAACSWVTARSCKVQATCCADREEQLVQQDDFAACPAP
jgi:hypothetical protein